MSGDLFSLFSAREGHFRYESGYHSSLWLDLDRLWLKPRAVQPLALELARQLAPYQPQAICGPIVGGALLALWIAAELGLEFYPTERRVRPKADGLYPIEYPLPLSLRSLAAGRRFAVVDDVISAGSAVRGSANALREAGGEVAVVAALLVLGDAAPVWFGERGIPVEGLARQPNPLWPPSDCPLCAAGVPLEDLTPDQA